MSFRKAVQKFLGYKRGDRVGGDPKDAKVGKRGDGNIGREGTRNKGTRGTTKVV